ncbi:MAG: iron-sulfur cluster assembly protein [Polaribacter sp.]|nr:iron-sulfur cluster assembly protein [Polaribacter sp.]MDG1810888.1 iron-sulfur cluster assembly protein [Polaribacter sp.]MDG1993123.1 iron-sulfur cluster assembly protein [Polaribacter sp.]
MTEAELEVVGDKIVNVIKTIYDPEIPVDIYELGLIYDVFVNEDNDAKILMTLTSPNCPVAESLPREVEDKVMSLKEINNAEVEITFDPTWTQEMMSEEAKLELGML